MAMENVCMLHHKWVNEHLGNLCVRACMTCDFYSVLSKASIIAGQFYLSQVERQMKELRIQFDIHTTSFFL